MSSKFKFQIAGAAAASSLLLTGCSSHSSSHDRPNGWHRPLAAPSFSAQTRADVPPVVHVDRALPTVSGRFGRGATIVLPHARPSGKFVVTAVSSGRGRAARAGDAAIVKYTAKVWRTNKTVPGPYAKGGRALAFAVGRDSILPAIDRAVVGHSAGSRLLVVAPPAAAYGAVGEARWGISGTDTVVFAVDVLRVIPATATVSGAQRPVASSLPQVRMDVRRGTASIAIPDHNAPTRLVATRLVEGTGPRVMAGQRVVLQYSTAVWQTERGKGRADLFASSHADGRPLAVVIGRGNVLKGWDKALIGQRAGDRLLLAIPADLAYGSKPPRGIPAGATVVSVIDILAIA